MNPFDVNLFFASLIWGSIGAGYAIYGKRQKALVPMVGGVIIVAASYLASGVWEMSLISLGVMAAVYFLARQGY